MKSELVIIDEFFPYLNKEPFLESEINFYNDKNVLIFACSANISMPVRKINQHNINFFAERGEKYRIKKLFRYLKVIFTKDFINELYFLISNRKFKYTTIRSLLSFMSVANHKTTWIKKELISLGFNKYTKVTFYSYWMHYHAYTALLLKKYFVNSNVITRCHGFDLYEFRNQMDYIPLRRAILTKIDEIHSISENGKQYLRNRYPNINMNIKVSRLGTNDYGWSRESSDRNIMKIVSCSWMVSVKRVDRIISSLEKINDINVQWTHYGDGELYSDIKKTAEQRLRGKKNIIYNLEGAVSNKVILEKYYKEQYHLFLNVSESEGIPVSIMEALSFGIPVIATDVGGVNEVVHDGRNGFLLEKDFTDEHLIYAIKKICNMETSEYLEFRKNARDYWEENYNAKKNYLEFINNL